MAICPIIVHFTTWFVRSMHDVGVNFVLSKDAQKQLVWMSLRQNSLHFSTYSFHCL